ncbi:podocalyxin [Neolamprologus brichardi]|uniref:podocalyxin n=1 Tax=Neolamprologus brichardi TaxID=32507 RepID=UPI0016438FB5|nr:podocalyxin [Neolamprologus brichardi]
MRATLRIKWLIVLLGFLCHSVYADTAAEETTDAPANDTSAATSDTSTKTAATTVSATTATGVTSSQNIDQQSTAVQTTQTTPASTQSTVKAEATGTTAALTPPTSTANETTTAVTTSTLAAIPTPAPSKTVPTPTTESALSTKPSTVTASPYSLSNKITAPYNVSSANERHESTNSPTASPSTAPAVTTVTAGQTPPTAVTDSLAQRDLHHHDDKIPESTRVPGGARGTTQLTNPGVSSTSSSVKKGVHTTTTDSAVQAPTATIKTPTSTQKFVYFHKGDVETKEKDNEKHFRKVCQRLMESMDNGSCTLNWLVQNGSVKIGSVEINGKVNESLAQQYYDELTQKDQVKTDNKTVIIILACGGAFLILEVTVGMSQSPQQHLTEELHTVENGYHDNPTLEVMEVQPEMLEKKMVLNGEFNDSWMVPLDHLSKEDHPEEEDTHL